jgi:hypothetical protein
VIFYFKVHDSWQQREKISAHWTWIKRTGSWVMERTKKDKLDDFIKPHSTMDVPISKIAAANYHHHHSPPSGTGPEMRQQDHTSHPAP